MNTTLKSGITEMIDTIQPMPCVAIVLPFNPAMSQKEELAKAFTAATVDAELQLHENYPEDIALLLMEKLNGIFKKLNFYVNKKSIAIFVSPVVEKVIYLDMQVEAKVKVANSFEIKEVISCKKQLKQFLLLHATKEGFKIYVGSAGQLIKIVSAPHANLGFISCTAEDEHISPAKAAIHHIDQTLDIILQTYKMPLFAAAAGYLTSQLKQHSRYNKKFIDYIALPESDTSHYQLQQLAATITADWVKVTGLNQRNNISIAAAENKLSTGITAVWREVMNHRSSLLIVEKSLQCCKACETSEDVIEKAIKPYSCYSHIRNNTDEIIEKVLEDGGDVEFAESNSLDEYDHMALIRK